VTQTGDLASIYRDPAMTRSVMRRLGAGILAVSLVACASTTQESETAREATGSRIDGPAAAPESSTARSVPEGSAARSVSETDASGATASGAPRSVPGVAGSPNEVKGSADGSPISIGILYTNNDAAPSAGVDNGNTFSARTAFEAFVASYNQRGGLAHRKIEPIYVELRSSSVALQADLQAACSTFTQDNHAALVLSAVGLFSDLLAQCLAKARTPQVAGDYALGDVTSLARAPSFYAPDTTTIDNRMRALLERTTAAHRVTPADKIGVVIEGCPYNSRAYARTVVPTAKRLGLTITDRVEARCFEGFDDFGGLASDMESAVLRLNSRGVTKVVFVSGSLEGNLMLLFGTAAESQGYRPGYALTSAASPAVQEANTPKAQLANAFGVGWLPALDTSRSAVSLPAAQRCVQDLHAGAGVAPASPADRYTAFSICDAFALSEAALGPTSGATDPGSVGAAIAGLGTGFAASATHGERTDFRNARRTGPAQGRLFAWSKACGCFDYTGQPFSLPSS
jgi:hypothetical protein